MAGGSWRLAKRMLMEYSSSVTIASARGFDTSCISVLVIQPRVPFFNLSDIMNIIQRGWFLQMESVEFSYCCIGMHDIS